MKAKIYYIDHSGFAIKTKNYLLIFDYFKEPDLITNNIEDRAILSAESLKTAENIIVFSSHSHSDHFNPNIFKWMCSNTNIQYVLSDDIKINNIKPNYHFIKEGEKINIKDVEIHAYGSTDIGISFAVTVDQLKLFHAGDLNWWHWKDDTLEERTMAEKSFKLNVDLIKANEKHIDIAFFPVDPRLKEFYSIGGEYFGKELNPKLFIPMHFGNDFYITEEFKHKMNKININSVEIACGYDTFEY
jgi:L-ascorbate metabolism protein UlaG (beta-lactamase superfamily)